LVVLWFGHVLLLNQPLGRGFVYAIFWAVPVTVVVVGATRSERARRLRAEGRDAQ
jgi:cytochrome c-type biogenesis protein CcmH/NrfF